MHSRSVAAKHCEASLFPYLKKDIEASRAHLSRKIQVELNKDRLVGLVFVVLVVAVELLLERVPQQHREVVDVQPQVPDSGQDRIARLRSLGNDLIDLFPVHLEMKQ